jgi:hypothetical protein
MDLSVKRLLGECSRIVGSATKGNQEGCRTSRTAVLRELKKFSIVMLVSIAKPIVTGVLPGYSRSFFVRKKGHDDAELLLCNQRIGHVLFVLTIGNAECVAAQLFGFKVGDNLLSFRLRIVTFCTVHEIKFLSFVAETAIFKFYVGKHCLGKFIIAVTGSRTAREKDDDSADDAKHENDF